MDGTVVFDRGTMYYQRRRQNIVSIEKFQNLAKNNPALSATDHPFDWFRSAVPRGIKRIALMVEYPDV